MHGVYTHVCTRMCTPSFSTLFPWDGFLKKLGVILTADESRRVRVSAATLLGFQVLPRPQLAFSMGEWDLSSGPQAFTVTTPAHWPLPTFIMTFLSAGGCLQVFTGMICKLHLDSAMLPLWGKWRQRFTGQRATSTWRNQHQKRNVKYTLTPRSAHLQEASLCGSCLYLGRSVLKCACRTLTPVESDTSHFRRRLWHLHPLFIHSAV